MFPKRVHGMPILYLNIIQRIPGIPILYFKSKNLYKIFYSLLSNQMKPPTTIYPSKQRKKDLFVRTSPFRLKSGNYLSSRQFSASTFGVKELNFCVRNGNRWILFAIITAMVIYLCFLSSYIYIIVYQTFF